jgi:hypothetical protein
MAAEWETSRSAAVGKAPVLRWNQAAAAEDELTPSLMTVAAETRSGARSGIGTRKSETGSAV